MSIVYVLGAGASFGERLLALDHCPESARKATATPPLIRGFFKRSLFEQIDYAGETAEKNFHEVFEYIRRMKMLDEGVGEGAWNDLNIEEIFTSIELDREFQGPESDTGAFLITARNQLIRYIWRIIGCCTDYKHAEYTKSLCDSLRSQDSVVTFNWDLLLDLYLNPVYVNPNRRQARWHYHDFFVSGLGMPSMSKSPRDVSEITGRAGMLLKLHGSLNWFQCTNARCPGSSQIAFDQDSEYCLRRAIGIHFGGEACKRCGSDTVPLLIPPLLRKPISDNWIIRSAWGHARTRLLGANKAVIIGFSAAGTDFYATWLLRSTLGLRKDVEIFVVDPANDHANENHREFSERMTNIFPNGYNRDFRLVSEMSSILERVVPAE
jgi:hypothetical protein